jgi:hypothetical protein
MTTRRAILFTDNPGLARIWLAVCMMATLVPVLAQAPPTQTPSAPSNTAAHPVVLDRVVAVVNNQAILQSDLDEEMRFSVLDPTRTRRGVLTPQRALNQLISRALIQQQIRQEDEQAVEPTPAEVASRIAEVRRELPACVHQDCATDAGWRDFLAGHGLTPAEIENYFRRRIEILRFIELRFRQGIRISREQIAAYYHDTLLPMYAPGEKIPPLDQVAPRIEEILLQQHVNSLFSDWLTNLRKQGEIEVLDPALESAMDPAQQGAGAE